jgi:hypothetical protein
MFNSFHVFFLSSREQVPAKAPQLGWECVEVWIRPYHNGYGVV